MTEFETSVLHVDSPQLRDKVAVAAEGRELTYSELARAVARKAKLLAGICTPGTRAIVKTSSSLEDVVSLLATMQLGANVLLFDRRGTDAELDRAAGMFESGVVVDGSTAQLRRSGHFDMDGQFFCLMTSGSSGMPKLVKWDAESAIKIGRQFARVCGFDDNDAILCTTPVAHSFGLWVGRLGPLLTGGTAILCPVPTASALHGAAIRHGATVIESVPFVYRTLLRFPSELPRLRLSISAGEALAESLRNDWEDRFNCPLANHYGATEAGQVSIELDGTEGSVGKPCPGYEVAIRPEPGASPTPETGLIRVRAPGRSSSYLGYEDEQDPSLNDGWFATGDIGYLDDQGRIRITGRSGRRINVAGLKVDPVEIEQAIMLYPGIKDCAVAGRHSDATGVDEIWAFVQTESLDERELRRHLAGMLSSYKIPHKMRVIESIPRSLTGKIQLGKLANA